MMSALKRIFPLLIMMTLALFVLTWFGLAQYRIEVLTPEHRRLHPFLEYKRVLTTPSCKLTKHADGSDGGKKVPAFSQYYIYDDDGTAYEVGTNTTGNVVGFLQKDCVLQWKLPLAMLFTNPYKILSLYPYRYRALIFDEETSLDRIIDMPGGSGYYRAIYDQVLKHGHAEHVISIEPEKYVDYQKNFYLLPILNSVESMFPDGYFVYKHEIASITTAAGAGAQKLETTKDPSVPAIVDFKAAVVFVIDSSMSMQPYIDRLKQAINTIYKSIEEKNLSEKMHIGVIAFRGDTKTAPGLEYTARMILRPGEATNAKEFNQKKASLEAAKVPSAQFNEDSYAGISMALNDINWNQYGGRYIVLITDAGAIDADDPQSSTGLDANALRLEAEHNGAAIYTLHLLTASGGRNHNHASAKSQYEILSFNAVINKPLYYGVRTRTDLSEDLSNTIDTIADSVMTEAGLSDVSNKDRSDEVSKSAVVFVIDPSMSMSPYIDHVKQKISAFYKGIEDKKLNDRMHVGLIALSTSPRLVHGVDFNAKMVLIPGEATNSKQFNQALSLLKLDTVQRRSFSMDSYAGISMALNNINWEQYDGRSIVLITDSGAFYADDPQSSTGLDAKDLQLEAERKDVDIYVLHLLTEEGRFNHASARNQYEIMSFNSKLSKPLYYDVGGNTGDVQRFGSMVDTLANSITSQVELAAESDGRTTAQEKDSGNQEEAMDEDSKKLGLALQLPYLGRIKGNHHPDFIRGWISERDIVDHDKMVGIPVVLLNRNQLSDLYTLIKGLLESCIAGKLGIDDMFSQLKSLAAQMGSDPNLLSKSQDIGEMGVMGDILERLPYSSRIYNFTPYDWFYLESEEQDSIIHDLENSLNYLQYCSSDNDHFIKLNAEADDSEAVYPVPLDVLP